MGASLVTLAEVKAYATITSDNQNTIINQLIPQVSEYVKTYCNRTFVDYVNEAKVEITSGGFAYILLKESPTISIQSIEYTTDYGVTYTTLTEYTDYILDLENDRIQCLSASEFPKQVNAYKITYYAGYETLPADLKLAILDIILYYLKSDMAIKSNASVGKNTVAVEYITTARLPSHISRVLDNYIQEIN